METQISSIAGHPFNLRPSDRAQVRRHQLASTVEAKALPESVAVARPTPWPLWGQLTLGACCMHGVLKAVLFVLCKKYNVDPTTMLSRLFGYYNGRGLEGTIGSDSGLSLADGIDAIMKDGVTLESIWPYDVSKFTEKPSAEAFREALSRIVISRHSLPASFDGIRQGLASGYPVIIGMTLHGSFERTPSSGIVPVPALHEGVLGGHCMLAWEAHTAASLQARAMFDQAEPADDEMRAGSWLSEALIAIANFATGTHKYSDAVGPVTLENWWGEDFGDKGYVHIDGAILNHDLFDAWQITDVQLLPAKAAAVDEPEPVLQAAA